MISQELIYFAVFIVAAVPLIILGAATALAVVVWRKSGAGPALLAGAGAIAVVGFALGTFWQASFDLLRIIGVRLL